jgi:glycosyl transferase family 87
MNSEGQTSQEDGGAGTPAALPLLDRLEGWLKALRWLAMIASLILLGVLLYRATLREGAETRGDTRFYQRGAQRFWAGESLYTFDARDSRPPAQRAATAYTYLPPFAAFLGWARAIPYLALRGLWLLASVLALWAALRASRRLAGLAPQPPPSANQEASEEASEAASAEPLGLARPWLWLGVLGLLLGRFVVNDLAHGQVNGLLALLLAAGLWEVYGERPLRGGVWIGLALVIKPTSWLLLPWLALDRRWRALSAACAVGVATLLMAWALYPGDYLGQLREWFELMPRFAKAEGLRPYNASLASTFERLLVGSAPRGEELQPLLLSLERSWAQPLARALAGLCVLGGLLAAAWLVKRERVSASRAAASVLALSALLSPVTWKAHFVVLLAPVAFVACDLARGRAGRGRVAILALTAALILLPSRGLGALGSGLEAWGSLSLSLVLMFGLCVLPPRGSGAADLPEVA